MRCSAAVKNGVFRGNRYRHSKRYGAAVSVSAVTFTEDWWADAGNLVRPAAAC